MMLTALSLSMTHAVFDASHARSIAARWKPSRLPFVVDEETIRRYTRARLALRRDDIFSICADQGSGLTLYVMRVTERNQRPCHVLDSILWGYEARHRKQIHLRELVAWHSDVTTGEVVFPGNTMDDEDREIMLRLLS